MILNAKFLCFQKKNPNYFVVCLDGMDLDLDLRGLKVQIVCKTPMNV